MSDDKRTTPDPTKEDVWIASIMGPAHLFPAGRSEALCGEPWISLAWSASSSKPASADCCSKCEDVYEECADVE